jgi:PAS domain S-box-containing protein
VNQHDLSQSVDMARDSLTALRGRLDTFGAAPESREIADALSEIEESLERLGARYGLLRDVLYQTSDIVFAKGTDGRYAMINPKGAEFFGKPMTEIVGQDDRALFGSDDAERIIAGDRHVMFTGLARTAEATYALRGVSSTLLTTTASWFDADRKLRGVIGIAQDVTQRRLADRETVLHREKMGAIVTEIVISEERLRRSLAAELHNGLGQDIALAKMRLSRLRESADPDLKTTLSGIEKLVEDADRSLRSITFQISPPSLGDLGLVAALQWLAEDVGRTCGIDVRIEDDGSQAIADERVRIILFRAVRELLVNVARHAGVRLVTVYLSRRGERVCITVADEGKGFEIADIERRGRGLFGIRQQLAHINGEMHVESIPGHGTTVILTAPTSDPAALAAT